MGRDTTTGTVNRRTAARGRHRGPTLKVLLLVATVTLGSLIGVASPAAAAVNAISLTVGADGTAPFDDLDDGPTNAVVRTEDTLTYQWNYSSDVAAGGSVTFVQTLTTSPLIRFEMSDVAQCTGAGGGSVSPDGHTLTCSVLVDATGAGSIPITVVPGPAVPHGTTIRAALTAAGGTLSGGAVTTTVVARPQLNLMANLWGSPVAASVGGAAGNGFVYGFVITEAAGARGTELVDDPLTFTVDLAALTPHATLVAGSCGANDRGGRGIPYGRIGIASGATASNSVVDSGAIGCSLAGQLLTVTITGADLSGATNPTADTQGETLAARTYLVSGTFTVFVPASDIGGTARPRTLQLRGFDPTSATARSNFGDGYEPGGAPDAPTCGYVADNADRENDNCYSTIFEPRAAGWGSYFVVADTAASGEAAGAATTGSTGDGVASPGEQFYDRVTIYSTSGPALDRPAACTKFDSSQVRVVGTGRAWKGDTALAPSDFTVEYASLVMATDTLRRTTSCGTGTWHSSIEAAGGPAAVSAVRFSYHGEVAPGEYVVFNPSMQVQAVAVGTVVATFSSAQLSAGEAWNQSYYVRETNSPSYTGNRMTVSDGRLRVGQSNDTGGTQSVQAGAVYTYTVTPTVTRATAATTPVTGVTVTSTLPSCARYVPDTASVPVERVVGNDGADGIPCTGDAGEVGPRLVFRLGNVVPGTAVAPITFQVRILRVQADNTPATHTAVISSDAAVPIDLAKRTSAASITVRNQTQFAEAETSSTPEISGDGPVNFVVTFRNLSGLSVPRFTVVTELPYSGDPNGSSFSGTLAYTSGTLPSNAAIECTGDPHGTISADPSSTVNAYGGTCDATTTAVRLTVTNLTAGEINRIVLGLTATGPVTGDRYVSVTHSSYVPNGTSVPVALPTGYPARVTVASSTLSGQAWSDTDDDGVREDGEVPVAGLPVALTGTDDVGAAVSRSTTTGTDGSYAFAALRAGTYVVTVNGGAPPPLGSFVAKQAGWNRSTDSDVNPGTGATDAIAVGQGAMVVAVDAGVHYGAPAVSLVPSTTSLAFTESVTLTATVPAAVTGTIDFTADVVSGPDAGGPVALGSGSISGGSAVWTGPLPAFGVNTVRATLRAGIYPQTSSAPADVENTAGPTNLLITQFRLSGPAGTADQYVQILNRSPFDVPLGGVVVRTDGGAATTLPASAGVLGSGRSYLVAASGYSLSAIATPDLSVSSLGGSAGVRVSVPDSAATVVDAVGSVDGYATGTPLPALAGRPADQFAWLRLALTGSPQDTGDNRADFALISTAGGTVGGVQSMTGSPSPQGTGSPVEEDGRLASSLLDPAAGMAAAPNRVVTDGVQPTLVVRRYITNQGIEPVTSLTLRINAISQANGAGKPFGPTPVNPAWILLVAPSQTASTVTVGGQSITVENLTPDAPSSTVPSGLNTTLTVPLPGPGLAPGESVPVALTFAIERRGPFWFSYDIES